MQLLVWQDDKLSVDCSQETLHDALQDQQAVVWLDLQITADDLAQYEDLLTTEFKLSPLTIHTIKEERERSRLTEQHNYFHLVVYELTFDTTELTATTPKLDIVFGHNFLVTIHYEPMSWLANLSQALRNDGSMDSMMSRGVPHVLHAVLDTLMDSYFPVLDDLDDVVDELENTTIQTAGDNVQGRIFRTKRVMAQMRRTISPQIEVINSLITRTGDFIPAEAEPYFADVHAHLVRTFEVLDSYRDLMSGLLDVFLTTVSNRLNQVMKQLTIIATIFLPISFITGVFGQNFGHSPQVEHDAGYNFWFVLAFMTLVTIVQLWYFKHRKWM